MITHILHAGSSDAPAMARLHKAGFAHPWDEGALRNLMDKPECLTLAAFAGERRLVGFVMTRQVGEEAEILTIVSDPKHRRTGIASSLLLHALELSSLRRATRMFLEVASGNSAAIALYQKHGFAEISRRSGYYRQGRDAPEDAIIMSRPLSAF